MILVIGDRHYPVTAIGDLSLRHVLALQRELVLTGISSARTFADVKRLMEDFAAGTDVERQEHPEGLFLTAVTVWAARVSAGEDITLLEAVDIPVSQLRWIKEPHDRQAPAEGKDAPRKSGAKRRTSKAK